MTWAVLALLATQGGEDVEAKYKELAAKVRTAKTAEGLNFLAEEFMKLADGAEARDEYEVAIKALQEAVKLVSRTKNAELAERAQARLPELKSRSQEYARVKSALKTLDQEPDNPAANLVVGKYLCFTKGDWAAGLARLSKGSDADLRSLATMEEAAKSGSNDSHPETQIRLGDSWWPKSRERALYWYALAWRRLDPLQKERVRERFNEAQARGKPKAKGARPLAWGYMGQSAPPPPSAVLVDEAYARYGRSALRIDATGLPWGALTSVTKPVVAGEKYLFSAWVLTERTPVIPGGFNVRFSTEDGKDHERFVPFPDDQPWWTRVEREFEAPTGTTRVTVMVVVTTKDFKEGRVWVDGVSLRDKLGQELVENGSFEK